MSIKERLWAKLLLIVSGLLIIGYIFFVSIRTDRRSQPEGEPVRLQDVLILTEALDESYGREEPYLELNKALEANGESYVTYRQFQRLSELLDGQENTDREKQMLTELSEEYDRKYSEESFLLLEDWYRFYGSWVDARGMEDVLRPVNITVLGVGSQVTDGEGKPLPEDRLLTGEGTYAYRSDLFQVRRYQTLKAYIKDEILLTIMETVEPDMSLQNLWVVEADTEKLQVFYQGYEIWFPYEEAESAQREQIADLAFSEGILRSVKLKKEKVGGRLLSMGDGLLEIEGMGEYACAEDMRVYRLYDSLAEGELKDLRIGYDYTDFVIEEGRVCAALISRDEAMENIRVVIKNTDFADIYHEKVKLTADTDFVIRYGDYADRESREFPAGETVEIDEHSEFFQGERICIEPIALTGKITLLSVERTQGTPACRGKLEITRAEEGLVIVNEVLLEEYLYSVVPSEMPASYPLEALKAQAVCARTYAYRNMQRAGMADFGAHVDDSVGYQVYNNIPEDARTTRAVKETRGLLLYYGEELCGSYYYSTSCGFGTDADIWKSESKEDVSYLRSVRIGREEEGYTGESMMEEENFASFICDKFDSDYESEEAWYRWTCRVDAVDEERMLENLKKRFAANPKLILTRNQEGGYESAEVKKLGKVRDIRIVKRGRGGVADELILEGTKNTFKVVSEYNIRCVLSDGRSMIIRQDGSEVPAGSLLPSAYFTVEVQKEEEVLTGYSLTGGGYGHGVGMSQNGARQMAEQGYGADEILTFFYASCEVRNIY